MPSNKKFFGDLSSLFKDKKKPKSKEESSPTEESSPDKETSSKEEKNSSKESKSKKSTSQKKSSSNSQSKNSKQSQSSQDSNSSESKSNGSNSSNNSSKNKSQTDTKALSDANEEAKRIVREAKSQAREMVVEAKDEALALKQEAEQEAREMRKSIEEQQKELSRKLDKVEARLTKLETRDEELKKKQKEIEKLQDSLEKTREDVIAKLQDIAGMTREEATDELFDALEKKLSQQLSQRIRQRTEEAEAEADEKVQEILVGAMKHGATDYVPEYTISTVELPSEGVKGKIIGKNGRNIHAFERLTGVDVDLDSAPTEVRLSCFDPVRREIARVSLKRLIKDGRIQPSRIEETVQKVQQEIAKITLEAGKQLCHDVNVYNLPKDLMQMLGKFKYRFSYGQNLIAHTLEETKIGIKLAHEMGADVQTVKLGCLLHDIGKVSEETEGSHVELGVKIAKKFDLPQPVVDCIAQHHEDEPFTGVEQMLVYIADAISGARPGARYENHEEYIERLEKLEEIATGYDAVSEAYAIQAGREIRVLLDPQRTQDDDVEVLAVKIRDRIKDEMTYPGTVTVNVIREHRGKAVAK